MKTINIIEKKSPYLIEGTFFVSVPVFVQMYLLERFGPEKIKELKYSTASNLSGDFMWGDQDEGYIFGLNLLSKSKQGTIDDDEVYNVFRFFKIPEFENSPCIIHKIYCNVLNAKNLHSKTQNWIILEKLLKRYDKTFNMKKLCIFKNTTRILKCPCCGKLI